MGAQERQQVSDAQKCMGMQRHLISEQQQKFVREKLERIKSTNGNMFDEAHQDAAEQLHEIEKKAYQAQFNEDSLKKKHAAYQGAIGELLHKLHSPGAKPKTTKTVKNLLLNIKSKSDSTKGQLRIAKVHSQTVKEHQLREAVKIAKSISGE